MFPFGLLPTKEFKLPAFWLVNWLALPLFDCLTIKLVDCFLVTVERRLAAAEDPPTWKLFFDSEVAVNRDYAVDIFFVPVELATSDSEASS